MTLNNPLPPFGKRLTKPWRVAWGITPPPAVPRVGDISLMWILSGSAKIRQWQAGVTASDRGPGSPDAKDVGSAYSCPKRRRVRSTLTGMAGKALGPRLFVKSRHNNTVLNWHREPEKEFHLYGEAFWNAAKTLLQNDSLDRRPIASFDASVIVYLYRHALELFLKEILIGRGGELIHPRPSPETVLNAGHSLTKLLPDVRRIFVHCGWDKTFGSEAAVTFDDFTAIVEEFEKADPSSFSFRYPVKKDLTGALDGHFTFSIRHFASTMDEVLNTLSGACYGLEEIADNQAEGAYEALQNSEPADYEPDCDERGYYEPE